MRFVTPKHLGKR